MPDCQVAGMRDAASPKLASGFSVFVVPLCAYVAFEDDLTAPGGGMYGMGY